MHVFSKLDTALSRDFAHALLGAALALSLGCARAPVPLLAGPLRLDSIGQEVELESEHTDGHGEEYEEFEPEAGAQSVGVFVGGSSKIGDRDGYTFGLDYSRRLTDTFGAALFAEGVSGLDRSFASGVELFWVSPVDVVLIVGGGAERREGEWERIFRLGIEYEIIQPGGWFIAPSVFYDIGETDDLLIYGVTVGRFF